MSTRAEELANKLASGWPRLEDLNDAVPELRRLAEVERQYLALKASIGEPVGYVTPETVKLLAEFIQEDWCAIWNRKTVKLSVPLYAIKDKQP